MTEQRIGKYIIIEEIGRGAMGVVYKAHDPLIERIVAIKTIRFDMIAQPEQREEAQKRFLREAKSAGQLSHPNIVTIYEVGEDQDQAFIAMEYIEGRSLEAWLADKRRWSVEETVRFIIEIAEALETTHRKNIVHRDIKPGNILVDADGHPHIVDFGIARIPASTLTQTTAVLGTPFYMAPEQISARKIDHRVDIFALGAIFYEMLTLEKPFTGENLTTIVYKIMNEDPAPLRQFKANLPAALEPLVRKILAKDPDARYQTCRALINDLVRFAEESGFATGRVAQAETSLNETKKLKRPPVPAKPETEGAAHSRKPLLIVGAAMAGVVVIAGGILLLTRKDARLPGPKLDVPAVSGDSRPAVKEEPRLPEADKAKVEDRSGGNKTQPTPETPKAKPVENKPVVNKPPAEKTEEKAKPPAKAANESAKPTAAEAAMNQARGAWQKGDGTGAMAILREILRVNPGDAPAQGLAREIVLSQSKAEIGALVEGYLTALKDGKAATFYDANCAPALAAALKPNVEVMDKIYDKLNATVGEVGLDFRNAQYPRFTGRASFPHTIIGRKRSNWRRETIFEGTYTWTLAKEGPRWIITDLAFQAR
jgi:serine/threonine protein kinase